VEEKGKIEIEIQHRKMRYSEAKTGRNFILRLEDGEILHQVVEQFAADHQINAAKLIVLGGADKGSILVVGPKNSRAATIEKQEIILDDVYEITGVGTIFRNEAGLPVSHIHISCGRGEKPVAGCARMGIKIWLVAEVVITELLDTTASRVRDHNGFELLWP
jgi:predicted DNA-binding protein with PD1-like motif